MAHDTTLLSSGDVGQYTVPTYIADEVGSLINETATTERVELLVGIYDGHTDGVVDAVTEMGATETERLPFNSLRVVLPKSKLEHLTQIDGVESIELDEGMEILAGN